MKFVSIVLNKDYHRVAPLFSAKRHIPMELSIRPIGSEFLSGIQPLRASTHMGLKKIAGNDPVSLRPDSRAGPLYSRKE
jgi:hypothetical protein